LEASFTEATRSIEFLLDRYQQRQHGEPTSTLKYIESGKDQWRLRQKVNYAHLVMNRVNLQGGLRDQVLYLIQEFPNTKQLCARCKCEIVITALVFYIKFSKTKQYPLNDYAIAEEVGLTDEIFTRITLKIANHFQDLYSIRHVRRVV
jgi:hypothetical protein